MMWSGEADYITSNFLKAVFHKFYFGPFLNTLSHLKSWQQIAPNDSEISIFIKKIDQNFSFSLSVSEEHFYQIQLIIQQYAVERFMIRFTFCWTLQRSFIQYVRNIFRKTNISYLIIRKLYLCVSGQKDISFSYNFG